jgi:hypothetical protein
MGPNRWRELVPLVELIYNKAPAASLNGLAHVPVMTGLAVMSPLDSIAVPGRLGPITLEAVLLYKCGNWCLRSCKRRLMACIKKWRL